MGIHVFLKGVDVFDSSEQVVGAVVGEVFADVANLHALRAE